MPMTRSPGWHFVSTFCAVAVVCMGLVFWWWQAFAYSPPPRSFDGDASSLQELEIVPTLDTPMPAGKSVLWCASFQLAWNQLKQDVIREPVRIDGAEIVADRLNRAEQSLDDIAPESVYAVAGFNRDGIVGRIKVETSARFPGAPLPELGEKEDDVITAFAHLTAGVKYVQPFLLNPKEFIFTDARGRKTSVASFGILGPDRYVLDELRKQIRVLYATYAGDQALEYAIDLSVNSQPNQIVLALIKPSQTLAETLAGLRSRMAKFEAALEMNPDFKDEELRSPETVTVPAMHWRLSHHFRELEGPKRLVLNDCCKERWMGAAYQEIEFCLDANGATVASSGRAAVPACGPGPRPLTSFKFDRPFLIYLKKRDAKHPFFVMWVNDAELLLPAKKE
jgi:hypothetical protein